MLPRRRPEGFAQSIEVQDRNISIPLHAAENADVWRMFRQRQGTRDVIESPSSQQLRRALARVAWVPARCPISPF
jgi:hypothetical protein